MQFWKKILFVSIVTCVLAPAASAGSTTAPALLQAMNDARAEHGVAPLRVDVRLRRAAAAHSGAMIRRGQFGHGGLARRMQQHGVKGPRIGENLAWGVGASVSARAIVSTWLASPVHRRNLLSPRFRHVGLGLASGTFAGRAGATVVTANFAGR